MNQAVLAARELSTGVCVLPGNIEVSCVKEGILGAEF
jgi:hypothetical protein